MIRVDGTPVHVQIAASNKGIAAALAWSQSIGRW